MVIESLRKLTAPIGVAKCAQIIGLDPKTLYKRIAEGKFHMSAVLRLSTVEEDIRIDPQCLAHCLDMSLPGDYFDFPTGHEVMQECLEPLPAPPMSPTMLEEMCKPALEHVGPPRKHYDLVPNDSGKVL